MECPECFHTGFVENYAQGDVVCTSCGLIVESCIPEREPYLPNSTVADVRPAPTRCRFSRTSEKSIAELCERAGLGSVHVVAQTIWNIARESPGFKVRKGKNAQGYVAAVIFHACKLSGVPRTPKEMCGLLGANLHSMRRMVKDVQSAADKVTVYKSYSFSSPDPVSILHRYLYKLDLSKDDQALLKDCARRIWEAHKVKLRTLEVDSVIAGMLYFMYGGNRDHVARIARACNVSRNTVTGVCNKIFSWEKNDPRPVS
eukprot:jgi/Tetstr1/447231/TSEL_034668.t1